MSVGEGGSAIRSRGPLSRSETVIRPTRGWQGVNLRELVAHRDLLFFLLWRDLKVRYQQTVIGASWAIIQPLAAMGIFTIVFGKLAGLPSDGVPYPLFCFSALVIWNLFVQGMTNAAASVISNHQLIEKVYFPRLAIPFAAILAGLADFLIAWLFLLVLMLFFGVVPGPRLIALVPIVALVCAASAGAGALLAALTVRFRDFKHLTPFIAQLWLFATPVVYSTSLVPERWRHLLGLNPMAGLVDAFRWAMLGTRIGSWEMVGLSALASLLLLLCGLLVFRRMERSFADFI